MNINEMATAAYNNAKSKGFWDDSEKGLTVEAVGLKLALIHSEVSEALEDAREGKMHTLFKAEDGFVTFDNGGKPVGFPSELADIVIRVGDLAKRMGIDLDYEIKIKMLYNAKRPRMHGKKA